jgi:predicted SnoaL-like aldol condensation-catalyzing enzyme
MSLSVKGRVSNILAVESGTSKAGKEWKKQGFIIDTGEQYNPEICFSVFGEDKLQMVAGITVGEDVEVHFNLSSREFNGKYYHNIDAWRIEKGSAQAAQNVVPDNAAPIPTSETAFDSNSSESDDLPF